MMLSLPRMFNFFNGLPHRPPSRAEPFATPEGQPLSATPATDSPGFLQGEFASFEPDLTTEIRQVLGEQAARRAGDVP